MPQGGSAHRWRGTPHKLFVWVSAFVLGIAAGRAPGQPVINEILINPPGGDAPNEYIELRGTPNYVFPSGSYLVVLEGDTNSNPGAIDDIFELSGKAIGGNGFLVLLQKGNIFSPNANAAVYANHGSGDGWGDASSSSIGHLGNTELENGSQTFLLIQTTNHPALGEDMDANDDGLPDHPEYASWIIVDSIGVMDLDADIVYGAINFCGNTNGLATGTVVNVPFEPRYVGRTGNTIGSGPSDWVVSGDVNVDPLVNVIAPYLVLGNVAETVPSSFQHRALNHLGAPNFGAPAFPGVAVTESNGSTTVGEGTGTDSYTVQLNTVPNGNVTIEIHSVEPVQISTDGGSTFGYTRTVTLANTTPRTVTVRALDDNVIDTSPNRRPITHTIINSGDSVNYPVTALTPIVNVQVGENDWLVLNELKVNPPGIRRRAIRVH